MYEGAVYMKVELKLDKTIDETKVVIYAKELNNDLSDLINKLQILEKKTKFIGYLKDKTYILDKDDIETFYAENNNVYARVRNQNYKIKQKLYELEGQLKETGFIRISHSEIANFNKVESLEIQGSRVIILKFQSNQITYVSRRYVSKIKQYLKI